MAIFHPEKLNNVTQSLSDLVKEYGKLNNVLVVCGHRSLGDQAEAYRAGKSNARPGKSAHNSNPSRAVDLFPCDEGGRINWSDIAACKKMATEIIKIADREKIKILWGGTFTRLGDYGHFELI